MPTTTLPALALHQPWATLIAVGAKTIETRSWPAPKRLIGQRIAVHAAVRQPQHASRIGPWTAYRADAVHAPNPQPHRIVRANPDYRVPGGHQSDRSLLVHELPLGAVVATARLAECLPMIELVQLRPSALPCLLVGGFNLVVHRTVDGPPQTVTDQGSFGWFEAGRWAWMLDDVVALDVPVPVKGRQGVFNVELPV